MANNDAPRRQSGIQISASQQEIIDNALLSAAALSDLAAVERALDLGARLDARLESGSPAMSALPKGNHREVVLAARPAVLGLCCHLATDPAISESTANDAMRCALLLIERGASVEAPPRSACSPLHCATALGSYETGMPRFGGQPRGLNSTRRDALVSALSAAGADLSAIGTDGSTALERALISTDPVSAKLLIDLGADLEARDSKGRTLLWRLAKGGYAVALPAAIELGCDIDAADFQGWTPLMAALSLFDSGRISCARALTRRGCRLTGEESFAMMASPRPWPEGFRAELAQAEAQRLRDAISDPRNPAPAGPRL